MKGSTRTAAESRFERKYRKVRNVNWSKEGSEIWEGEKGKAKETGISVGKDCYRYTRRRRNEGRHK